MEILHYITSFRSQMLVSIVRTWPSIVASINEAKDVNGLVSNVIWHLKRLGWTPNALHKWITPRGDTFEFIPNKPVAVFPLISKLIDDWRTFVASLSLPNHYGSEGLVLPIDWPASLSKLYTLKKQKLNVLAACLLTVMAGACWPNHRVHSVKPEVSPICSRCELEVDTPEHFCWHCPTLDTQHLALRVDSIKPEYNQAFWCRGLI